MAQIDTPRSNDVRSDSGTDTGRPRERRHPLSTGVRMAILVAIIIAAVVGYLIASSVFGIACSRSGCADYMPTLWGIAGALVGMLGAAVMAVLLSRSFAEWYMVRKEEAERPNMPVGDATADDIQARD